MHSSGSAIRVTDLVKRYGGATAVHRVSFDVPTGSVFALLGPNGAGKTTTVECIEGFRRPDGGTVRVLGLDPRRDRNEVVARMGVMLQEGGVYQAASAREVLRLHARFHPRPHDPDALLQRVGLDPASRTRYRNLSGGQKQRLNLALSLVGRPDVVILDEPTAGMDPQARQATWSLIRELREDGVTVLLTTHFMDEAERLADLVAIIDRGQLLALDSPAALVAGSARGRILVTTSATVDPADLAAGVGFAVEADGAGRLVVHAGPDAIPPVTAWFAAHGLPVTGVSAAGGGLEDVFLQLTGKAVRL